MACILITSGPTREYLDPVRFLSNGSSGRMGSALAAEALRRGHDVLVVSGPVCVAYPSAAHVISVESTDAMAEACIENFARCDGAIAAAAPCDYRSKKIATHKLAKDGGVPQLELVETRDIIAELGNRKKGRQWTVAFALETHDGQQRAMDKLWRKKCDLIVLNDPSAIDAEVAHAIILNGAGHARSAAGKKSDVASALFDALADAGFLPKATTKIAR